jgi:hypothetical protein
MRQVIKISTLLMVCLISLLAASPILAIPLLPSSFYGIVKVNNANVPDGTVVQALIGGKIFAEGLTQAYEGDTYYSLDVPSDETGTSRQEGGRDGDTIHFQIGGLLAEQTGTWRSGINVKLDLSASSPATLIPSQDTPTPIPSQTTIILVATLIPLQDTPTPMPTQTARIIGDQPTATSITKAQSTPTNALIQPGSTIPSTTTKFNKTIGVIGIVGGLILITLLWLILVRKPKVKKP